MRWVVLHGSTIAQASGHVSHDFEMCSAPSTSPVDSCQGTTTPLIQPGQTAKITVTLAKGSYPYLCTVPGHAEAGMKGVFTVG